MRVPVVAFYSELLPEFTLLSWNKILALSNQINSDLIRE
jgi:hypothetical protein